MIGSTESAASKPSSSGVENAKWGMFKGSVRLWVHVDFVCVGSALTVTVALEWLWGLE